MTPGMKGNQKSGKGDGQGQVEKQKMPEQKTPQQEMPEQKMMQQKMMQQKMMQQMAPPARLEESFDTPAAAAARLGELARGDRLAGSAMLEAAPTGAVAEGSFAPHAMRAMWVGALVGAALGIVLGTWFHEADLLVGSWGGLMAAGAPAIATGMALALAALGALLGGLVALGASDPAAAHMPHARLRAMVKGEGGDAPGSM